MKNKKIMDENSGAKAFLATNTEEEEIRRGQMIADVLGLEEENGRYFTTWGNKTALGLFRVMDRIIKDGE